MTKLDRTRAPEPTCLQTAEPGLRYSQLTGAEKAEIRAALLIMQKQRCAYCERRTAADRDDGHIEHFRKQADNRSLEVSWPNLYWSCKDEGCCGKNKDKCGQPGGGKPLAPFDPDDLIDPCVDDPERFLMFVEDGTVQPQPDLSPRDQRRAEETIRVFRLNDSAYLRKMREDAVRPYKTAIDTLLGLGLAVLAQYIDKVRVEIEEAPFSAAIRQYIRGLPT